MYVIFHEIIRRKYLHKNLIILLNIMNIYVYLQKHRLYNHEAALPGGHFYQSFSTSFQCWYLMTELGNHYGRTVTSWRKEHAKQYAFLNA